jgi:ribosome-associated protein
LSRSPVPQQASPLSSASPTNHIHLSTQVKFKQKPLTAEELADLIIESIQEIKGKNIVKLDLRRLEDAPTDFFVICEGTSTTQVRGIAGNVQRQLKAKAWLNADHVEGEKNALWVCMDYFSVVVHVFMPETRMFYELEDLWGDATITQYDSL